MKDLKALREARGLIKCRHCGANNTKTLTYCKHCGHRLVVNQNQRGVTQQGLKGTIPSSMQGMRAKEIAWSTHLKQVVKSKLGLTEVQTEILPIEEMSLEMMKLLAEESKQKQKQRRLTSGIIAASCLIGLSSGWYWYDQRDIRSAKIAYAEENLELLKSLKEEMDSSDWATFEAGQVDEIKKWIQGAQQGKIVPASLKGQIARLMQVLEDEKLKQELMQYEAIIQRIEGSQMAYQEGLDAIANESPLEAYKAFLKVEEQEVEYQKAQAQLKQIEAQALEEWKGLIQDLLTASKYEELVEEATLYLSIQPKDANIVAIKKQAEQALKDKKNQELPSNEVTGVKETENVSKNPEQLSKEPVKEEAPEEASKNQSSKEEVEVIEVKEEEVTYQPFKNNQVIKAGEARLKMQINRFSSELKSTTSTFKSDSGKLYFEYIFDLKNTGDKDLLLEELVTGAAVTDGDGTTYDQFACFYTEGSEGVRPVYGWSVLKPGKTTTYRVVIQVPASWKTKVTPLTARIKIKDQWYQKDIPAQ